MGARSKGCSALLYKGGMLSVYAASVGVGSDALCLR